MTHAMIGGWTMLRFAIRKKSLTTTEVLVFEFIMVFFHLLIEGFNIFVVLPLHFCKKKKLITHAMTALTSRSHKIQY